MNTENLTLIMGTRDAQPQTYLTQCYRYWQAHHRYAGVMMLLLMVSFGSAGGIVSTASTLSNGSTPDLQGLEWLSLDHTRNYSYNDVDSMLASGLVDVYGTTWAANTWRYATQLETQNLLRSLYGWVAEVHPSNYAGVKWWQEHLGLLAFDFYPDGTINGANPTGQTNSGFDYVSFLYGSAGACYPQPSSCLGNLEIYESYPSGSHSGEAVGIFRSSWGLNAYADPTSNDSVDPDTSRYEYGSLLVRSLDNEEDNGGDDEFDVNAPLGGGIFMALWLLASPRRSSRGVQ